MTEIITVPTDYQREKALLEGMRGPREWRYELWRSDISGNLLESGPFRRLEALKTIESGSLSLSNFRDHTWELGINMLEDETLDLFADWVRLYVLLRDGDTWRTYPRGLYKFDFPRGEDSSARTRWDLTGKSAENLLVRDQAHSGYKVASGTGVLAAVRTVLLARGIPAAMIDLPTGDKTLTREKIYDPLQDAESCYYLRICNDLLATGGFYALWTDEEGRFTTREIEDTTETATNVTYGTTRDSERLIRDVIRWEYSEENFANKIVVRAGGAQGEIPVTGVAENRDPDSRVAIQYKGVVQGEEVVLENLISQTEANKVAKAHLRIASGTELRLEVPTFSDPRRQPRDRYTLEVYREDETPLWLGRWRVTGLDMPLDFSGMSHQIYREIRL